MAADPNAVEQAVSRTLRDNLEKIQRPADELHQAVNDMVAACASSRASNALPSMVRAQTSAASLSATLEVLLRFVTSALQPPMRMPFEPEVVHVPSSNAPPVPAFEQPPPPPPPPKEEISWAAPAPGPAPVVPAPPVLEIPPPVEAPAFSDISPAPEVHATVDSVPAVEPVVLNDPPPVALHEPVPDFEFELPGEAHPEVEASKAVEPLEAKPVFNLDLLPPD